MILRHTLKYFLVALAIGLGLPISGQAWVWPPAYISPLDSGRLLTIPPGHPWVHEMPGARFGFHHHYHTDSVPYHYQLMSHWSYPALRDFSTYVSVNQDYTHSCPVSPSTFNTYPQTFLISDSEYHNVNQVYRVFEHDSVNLMCKPNYYYERSCDGSLNIVVDSSKLGFLLVLLDTYSCSNQGVGIRTAAINTLFTQFADTYYTDTFLQNSNKKRYYMRFALGGGDAEMLNSNYAINDTLLFCSNNWSNGLYCDTGKTTYKYNYFTAFALAHRFMIDHRVPHNSGPQMESRDIGYAFRNQPYVYYQAAYDDDGDSLWAEHRQLEIKPNNYTPLDSVRLLPYLPGLSLSNPLPCNNTFQYDTTTGDFSFTPSQKGFYQFLVRFHEYRSGEEIGFMDRLIGIHVIDGQKPQPKIKGPISSYHIVSLADTNRVCAEDSFSMTFQITTSNSLAGLDVTVKSINLPGLHTNFTNLGTSNVGLRLSMQTSIKDTGWHTIRIMAKDTSCVAGAPWPTYAYRNIKIYISPNAQSIRDTTICPGESVLLTSNLDSLSLWSVISGDVGSLTCTACAMQTVSPQVTTRYVLQGQLICKPDTVTVTVRIPPSVSAGVDRHICDRNGTQDTILLSGIIRNPLSTTAQIQWSRISTIGTNPSPSNSLITSVGLGNGDNVFVIHVTDSFGCASPSDTIHVYYALFTPTASISDDEICLGDSVTVTASGGNTYLWTPSHLMLDSSSAHTLLQLTEPNSYVFTVNIKDTLANCQQSLKVGLLVKGVYVNAGADQDVSDGARFDLDGSLSYPSYANYYWTPADYVSNPNSQSTTGYGITQPTWFYLSGYIDGCTGQDSVLITPHICVDLGVPNGFSPQSGNVNTYFKPTPIKDNFHLKMKIFNRWGNLIYDESGYIDALHGWDGTYKGEAQPIENYIYDLEVQCTDEQGISRTFHKTGSVLLIR